MNTAVYSHNNNVPTEYPDLAYLTASVLQHLYAKAEIHEQKHYDLHALTCSLYDAFQLVRLPASIAHLATFYTYKIIKLYPKLAQKHSPLRLFIIAYSLADTHLDDNAYSNRSWVQVLRKELNINQWNAAQIDVLQHGLHWSLEVEAGDWKNWMNWLDSWWAYYEDQYAVASEEEEDAESVSATMDACSTYSSGSLMDSGYEEEGSPSYFKAKVAIRHSHITKSYSCSAEEAEEATNAADKGWKNLWKQAVRRKFRWTL